ncbi:MAG: hypothetical protein ACM36C_00435, partial [Acidobacteriota bacterium]
MVTRPPAGPPVITRPPVVSGTPVVSGPASGAGGPVVAGPVGTGPIVVGPAVPFPHAPSHVGNFFDKNRAGRPVVRPNDLIVLRFEFDGLVVQPGEKPRLRKPGAGDAFIVVHFPPQAITERSFFETKPKGTTTNPPPPPGVPDKPETGGGGSEELEGPPVRARISGESRVVFKVPDGFDIEYTLEGVLTAIEQLELSVPANARPPVPKRRRIIVTDIFSSDISALPIRQRAALTSFAMRSLRIAAVQRDAATFALRQATGGAGLQPIDPANVATIPDVVLGPRQPRPAEPGARQTAIELPWRLILSPHSAERWRHTKALPEPAQERTELWHSTLVAPKSDGTLIEPPHADPQRTVRAVWALTGEGSQMSMQSAFPNGAVDLPTPDTNPFRMPLTDFDRFQITHLSSNFSRSGYSPAAIDTNLLMLSALGGWLDSRGAWDVPPGMSVEEWVHRATMGRDHYVRVVYKGFAFPFGHRVALVKVTERKFHNGAIDKDGQPTIEQRPGNTAYLRERLFIVPRERERLFVDTSLHSIDGSRLFHFEMPFSSVRLLTPVTPNLDQPNVGPSAITLPGLSPASQKMFWPCVSGAPYRFQYSATDLDGRTVMFDLPIIFIDNTLLPDMATAEDTSKKAQTAWQAATSDRRQAEFKQQRVAFAQSVKAGDTSLQADTIGFDAEVEPGNATLRSFSDNLSHPP